MAPIERSSGYSVKGSLRKTAEFAALSLVIGGDIHYRRWPVTKRGKR